MRREFNHQKVGEKVNKKQIMKLFGLNLGIAVLDVLLLSKGLIHIFGIENIFLKAIGITAFIMSIILFGYGNYSILLKPKEKKLYKITEFKDANDYIEAFKDCPNQKYFSVKIKKNIRDVEKLMKKKEVLKVILSQYFTPGEMSYVRFENVIDGTMSVFLGNIQKIINRINIIDADTLKEGMDNQICQEYIRYIESKMRENEEILLKLDNLILEISKLDDVEGQNLEELPAIQEINDLISNTQYYK